MPSELVCAATDPAWLERRREGITATDIVTIAGLVTWDSPWALYHRKLGLLPEVEQSWRMERGRWIEPGLADYWRENVQRADLSPAGLLYRSKSRPWQMATPDYQLLAPDSGVLECKSTQDRRGWGKDGTDEVPKHVRAQVLWQMDTLGVATGHVAADLAGEFRSYTIRHDCLQHGGETPSCAICWEQREARDLGFGFWSRILTRRTPDLDGLEVTTDALRYLHPAPGGQVDLTPPWLWRDYDSRSAALAEAKRAFQHTQNLVREAMGDASEATVGGRVVFRRTIGKRAGYEVPPGETDVLRRIGKDKHDD